MTWIIATFSQNNVKVLQGFADTNYDCTADGTRNWTNVTPATNAMLGYGTMTQDFWQVLWQNIKTFFAQLFGGDAFAVELFPVDTDNPVVADFGGASIGKWCQTDVRLTPAVRRIKNANGNVTASKVSLYLNRALEPHAYVLITFNGSPTGVRNSAGVPIMEIPVKYHDANGTLETFNRSGDFFGFKTGK